MSDYPNRPARRGSLRTRILTSVGALVLLSLLGSVISLYRITEVNRSLDSINRVSVPLGRLLAQMQSDADIFRRELERSLGNSHWNDPHWKPRPLPRWIGDVLVNEVERARELLANEPNAARWRTWLDSIAGGLRELRENADQLYQALERKDLAAASAVYPKWAMSLEEWSRQLQWGVSEYERNLRQTFSQAESRVSELRTGLEIILAVVVGISLLLLWFGERAIRPLHDLTLLAREITRRGLRKEDKALLSEIPIDRQDEVSQLAREFHRMATSLLEREKVVESQKARLQDQNRLLREIGTLNKNILNSIKSVLIVTDLDRRITQCNPLALEWLGGEMDRVLGTDLLDWGELRSFPDLEGRWNELKGGIHETARIDATRIGPKIYGGSLMALRHENGEPCGAILVLEDLTEEREMERRLRHAENLAAVGRMSAQVAHEVRNPLHSIGLEAEMAAEMAARAGDPNLKQSLQSILSSVDRLEKITANYLKLSRLSAGDKTRVDLRDLLQSVLATYASACEAGGVRVDWRVEERALAEVWGDRDLLEHVMGNLFRNALQALEGVKSGKIDWALGNTEAGWIWFSVTDNGPGIAEEIRDRLFTPFVTTKAQGTGLGLSFVKKVVEDHAGTVTCMDSPSGHGTRFEIRLPASSAVQSQGLQPAKGVSVEC